MTTAERLAGHHALKASQMLEDVEELEGRIAHMSQDERLQAIASGSFQQINRDISHTVCLAQAHALTGLACAWIEDHHDGVE